MMFSVACTLWLAKMFDPVPQRQAFNGHHFRFNLQTVGVDRSTHLRDIWWFSSDTRRFAAGKGPDQSCLASLWACSKLTYLLSRRKTCLMLDHWCLPCGFLAWKRLTWFRWGSYLFQGQSPENSLADWKKWLCACYSIFTRWMIHLKREIVTTYEGPVVFRSRLAQSYCVFSISVVVKIGIYL